MVAVIFVLARGAATAPYLFEVSVTSSVQGFAQLYYDIGGGFREAHSARVPVLGSDETVALRFPLPHGQYRAFRLDPIDREAEVVLAGARVLQRSAWSSGGRVVLEIPASGYQVLDQIHSLTIDGARVRITTVDRAYDPMILLPLDRPLILGGRGAAAAAAELAVMAVIVWFLLWLADRVRMRYGPSVWNRCSAISAWSRAHPRRTIAGMALVAAILSCHPVVFFGRSFVSPDYGTFLLYDRHPTVPGYRSTFIEDSRGSDVGAVMWAHAPYSVIESRAIVHEGELPLWNRFNSAGLPLLGQGQSMLGDPLHLGVILAGGASWAWDAKFVIAKFLLALGLGLIIHALTRHLPAALVLTFSSLFIGFFAFRLNHPAFFSFAYSPWILYFWIRFAQCRAEERSAGAIRLGGLILADWAVMNSGTAKEAYMLLIFLNISGLLIFLLWRETWRDKLRKATPLVLAQALFVMVSAPIWVTFREAIHKSFSSYDVPEANQFSPKVVIGLFDGSFYGQIDRNIGIFGPSANFLILLGFLWAIARFRGLAPRPGFLAIALGAFLSFSLAFGVVPADVVMKIPYLANVVHVGNTFSVVLIVHLVILAGFGVQACWESFPDKRWYADWVIVLGLLGGLVGLYVWATASGSKSDLFVKYAISLVLAFAALPVLARRLVIGPVTPALGVLLVVSFAVLQWRHGMYLRMGLDDYVVNPPIRANLQPDSPALAFMRHDSTEPFRAVGLGRNLYAGYNAAVGVESIYGPDALVNPYYRALTKALPLEWEWDWRINVREDNLGALVPAFDALNVKYYLSHHYAKPAELPRLRFADGYDLDVHRSDTVWPRAFFSDTVQEYGTPGEFVDLILGGDGRPFAAVEKTDLEATATLQRFMGGTERKIVPAMDYRLTTNLTSFSVDAPGPGVIVLTEGYMKDDFRVTLNGRPARYFRVNHAFKGVVVDGPGTYAVAFSYWPRYFSQTLAVSTVGFLILLLWLGHAVYRAARAAQLPHHAAGIRAT